MSSTADTTLPSYPSYSDSEARWIGQLPSDWDVLRGKFVFAEFQERSETGDELLLSVSEYYGVKPRRDAIDTDEFLSRAETLIGYKRVEINDLAMNIMLAWKKGLGVSKYSGIVSPSYSVFRFGSNANPDYMHYLLRTDLYADYFKSRSTGIMDSRLRLYPDSFRDVHVILPALPEQKQIALFLDYETSKIDALISKQQQLIALLGEKRQAVISHAVTKGLNPDAPMRDSGIQWLGDVPEHWETTCVKNICYVNDGNHGEEYPKDSDAATKEVGVPFIRAGDFENFTIVEDDLRYISHAKNDSMRKGNLQENDILFVNRGATIGKVGLIDRDYIGSNLNSQIAYLRVEESEFSHRFLLYFLSSTFIQETVVSAIMGGALPQYPIKHIINLPVCEPPLDEQREIAAHLASVVDTLDLLESRAKDAIDLIEERRTALISAAVTGKIDVRGWKPPSSLGGQETEMEVA